MQVRILEPDDGSGWVKVADQDGNSGLVPASYIQTQTAGSADTAERLGSGERGMFQLIIACLSTLILLVVRAIYPYIAQGLDELSLQEGDIMELSSGPTGGKKYGDGWWEGK
jgi:formin-binding protein 1